MAEGIQASGKGMSNDWQKRAVKKFYRTHEVAVVSGAIALVFSAVLSAQVFFMNQTFVWVNLELFSALSWSRVLFSAITFLTLGRVLYKLYFYKILSFIFHVVLRDHRAYIATKEIIWWGLMLFVFFYVQPIVFKFLNIVVTVLYNIIALLAYSLPAFGISLLMFVAYMLVKRMVLRRRKDAVNIA